MKHKFVLVAFILALAAWLTVVPASAQNRNEAQRPRLVVLIVLDQFRAEYLDRFDPWFSNDGFRAVRRSGAEFSNTHYSHGTTYTGPGHALLNSGTYGHRNGIIGNRWYNRETKRIESMFFDAGARLLGMEATPKDDDTSPRNFIGSNLSDQLVLSSNFRSRVVGMSLKDRAAIMLAGKQGRALWYHEVVGQMLSSTFYMPEVPAWVREFNNRKLPDSYFGKVWEKSLPAAAYPARPGDDAPWETDFRGLGRTFPHRLQDKSGKPSPDFYEAFTATPFAIDYQLELARLAIEREQLGLDEWPDLLGVSITSTDIAGHAYGPDSHELQDMIVRLDRQLAGFLAYLKKRFPEGSVLTVLTSDHGACPVPEYMATLQFEAARIKKKQLSESIEAALDARYGEATWILALEDPGVYLDHAVMAERKLNAAEVERTVGEAARRVRGVKEFFTRSQLLNGELPPTELALFFERSFNPLRSGDVLLVTEPYFFWGSYGERDAGTTHGSPWSYDTQVPLLLQGAGVRPGRYTFRTEMVDLAPTLASLMRILPPAGVEGRVLHEALR